MDSFLFFAYAVAYIALIGWGLLLAKKYLWRTSANVVLLVAAALFYDNLIVAMGRFIGEGTLLEQLNYVRFWLHALFTPLLVVFAWNALKRAEIQWAKKNWAKIFTFIIVIGLIILEIITEVWGIKLEAKWEYAALSYHNAEKQAGPPWMVLFVSVILLLIAIIICWKQRWPWFLVGVTLLLIGSFLMSRLESGAIMNGFELLLMTSLLATKQFQETQRNT